MPRLLRSLHAILGLAVVFIAMAAIGFIPLFDGPGYESSLAAGLIVPFVVAVVTALDTGMVRSEPFDAFCRGIANGGAIVGLAFFITLLHGLRAGFCDAATGSANFALGPGVGALQAGAWGALCGEIASSTERTWVRRTTAISLAIGGPLISMALSVSRFYSSPIVFAYDPFVGYFSGSFYDTVIDLTGLLTYRAGSMASLFTAFVIALHLGHDDLGRIAFQAIGRPGMLVFGGATMIISIGCIVTGYRLGHWQTSETISAELGALVTGERCDVVYPRAMRLVDAQRFARDCDAHVQMGERWFGGKGPDRITAFLFADARQKAALMGAADTQIAKPWRREVYLQAAGYPHPSLGHEIAHVLAGTYAHGPFKVAGSAGGWIPNPGLIEGMAVAASPKEGDLSPRDWAKAMKDLGLLPPLSKLFAFGFFGENSATAYTASGAFVEYIRQRFGVEALQTWYGGFDLPKVTGVSWEDLERDWHQDLDKISLPDAAKAQAAARFDRPSLFGRRCPHVVDGCKKEADRLHSDGDEAGAAARYRDARTLDPSDDMLIVSAVLSDIRAGKVEEGKKELERIARDESLTRHARDRAIELLGDLALVDGESDGAVDRYREIMNRIVDEDHLRTLEVKIAAARQPQARTAIVALLIGTGLRGPERMRAAEALGAWSALASEDGLPDYLLARQYVNAGEFQDAAERLDRTLSSHVAIQRVQIEAERLRIIVACGLGDGATAERLLGPYVARDAVWPARKEAMQKLVERCTRNDPTAKTNLTTGAKAP